MSLQQRNRRGRNPTSRIPASQSILEAAGGKALDIVALNPNNLIYARLLVRYIRLPLDKSLLVHRLSVALSLLNCMFEKPF